jgi:N-acetylneuraminic acid mutarotase
LQFLCSTSDSGFRQDRRLVTNRIRSASAALLFLGCLVTLTSAFNLPNRSANLSSLLDSPRTLTKPTQHRTLLSLADRVAYQRAIEEVYWRQRIWPKERSDPKPSLGEVMPSAQMEKKVEDYLSNSEALEDYWQKPISAEQLQAEMERMAKHTKQPEVLRELFEALGNDPFVIAECLARPVLSERLVTNFYALDERFHGKLRQRAEADLRAFKSWRATAENQAPNLMAAPSGNYTLPKIADGTGCVDDTWTATSTTNAPSARSNHTAVWTGNEMIVWGGIHNSPVNTGGRYDPTTDSWTATSTTNAPTARYAHTAVWTGSEMIVWGGDDNSGFPNTGGRYNPTTDTWTATSTANAPTGRQDHTAIWTGSEMIVWDGDNGSPLNSGGRYNPSLDSWTPTSTTNAPTARTVQSAVWTGSEMIVWGGYESNGIPLNTGGTYNPTTDSWTATSTTNAPTARWAHKAVWTGSEMILWGGYDGSNYVNTGGTYNPTTDSWTATNSIAPTARYAHTAVWTGSEMIVWGGFDGTTRFNDGGRYNPGTDTWTPTTTINAPSARFVHTAVWSGSEMIVWGGYDTNNNYLNTGGIYCAQPSTPIVQSAVSRKTHGSVGSFDIAPPLNGTAGIECRTGGATNDYTLVVTFNANVSVNGNPQAAVTLGIGVIGTGGVSNGGRVTIAGNVVAVPLTNVANAQTINVTLFGVNGSTNVVIPMSVLIVDTNGNGTVNASDVSQTKSQVGQPVGGSNFREDVNANGTISSTDVAIVKSDVGTSLPP